MHVIAQQYKNRNYMELLLQFSTRFRSRQISICSRERCDKMSQDVQHVRDSVLQGYLHNVQTTETFLIDPYKEWSNAIPDAYLGGMAHRMLSKLYESVRTCCRGVITVVLVVFCWFISLLNVQGTLKNYASSWSSIPSSALAIGVFITCARSFAISF